MLHKHLTTNNIFLSLSLSLSISSLSHTQTRVRNEQKKTWNFSLGDDLLEFHQAVVSTLRDADDMPIPLDPAPMPPHIPNTHSMMPFQPMMNEELGRISDVVNTDQPLDPEDEVDPGMSSVWWKIQCPMEEILLCWWLKRIDCEFNLINV